MDQLRFGDVTIDVRAGVVRLAGTPVVLRPKAYDVLLHFARHPGTLLSQMDLLAAVWPDVSVTPDSLVQCLVEIRRVLGAAAPITTVRGRGYRLDATVMVESAADTATPGSPVDDPAERVDGVERRSTTPPTLHASGLAWRPRVWLTACLVVAAMVLFAGWAVRRPDPGASVGRPLGVDSLDAEAIRLHEEGRVLLREQTRVGALQAVERFDAAARRDPSYAGAWSGLAHALTRLHIYGSADSQTVLPRARAAAVKAIALDPTLADAHSALAHVLEQYDRDWDGADASHRRAIALDPRDAKLRQLYALFLVSRLRVDEALAEMDRARELASTPGREEALRGVMLMFAGRPTDALAALDAAGEYLPSNSLAEYFRALVLANLGRFDEALAAARAARVEAGNEPTLAVGIVHALAGREADAREVWRALEAKAATSHVPATDFAMLAAALGEDDLAVRWLERAADQYGRGVPSINVHPIFRRLRAHPGYVALVKRLDLPLP